MLTKEERAAIAERLRDHKCFNYFEFYEAITGKEIPRYTSRVEDIVVMSRVIIDLCDTSNMIELPLDKDGKVIRVGDTLYCGSSTAYKAKKIIHNGNEWEIQFFDEKFCIPVYDDPDTLTHKKPVTIELLASDIKRVANQGRVDRKVYEELFRIAWALESLGDKDAD
ncbi:hypothetical protein [Lancefieldella parvula]|uniref:hypothetical protein n=1 Tax=Lancefieldella parvula TaxID=1382 RepID=UPI00288912DD|nr:hypothetical protein [Lancefieldella parvula]